MQLLKQNLCANKTTIRNKIKIIFSYLRQRKSILLKLFIIKCLITLILLLVCKSVMAQDNTSIQASAQPTSNQESTENVYTEGHQGIALTKDNPEFIIQLRSNPTTGYSWFVRDYDKQLVIPVKHEFHAPENKRLMGAPGYEVWTFKMKPEGFKVPLQTVIRFVYARPWEALDETQIIFKVSTR